MSGKSFLKDECCLKQESVLAACCLSDPDMMHTQPHCITQNYGTCHGSCFWQDACEMLWNSMLAQKLGAGMRVDSPSADSYVSYLANSPNILTKTCRTAKTNNTDGQRETTEVTIMDVLETKFTMCVTYAVKYRPSWTYMRGTLPCIWHTR